MPIQAITGKELPESPNPFSQGIKSNGFLFVSGQVGKDGEGNIVEGFTSQVDQTMRNLASVVRAGGLSLEDVVSVTVYLTDISRLPDFNEVYKKYFDGIPPSRCTVEVNDLGLTAEVEVQAIAAYS